MDEEFRCPRCLEVLTLESVFNPKTGNYERVYVVTTHELDGGIKVWYTYNMYKVPIYATGPNGEVKIVGYRYEWLIIPELTAIETGTGGSKMIFE